MAINNKQSLQAVLDQSLRDKFLLDDYNLCLSDDQDVCGADGLWDLAGIIAMDIIPFSCTDEKTYDKSVDELQTLLYNLFRGFVSNNRQQVEQIKG